MADKLQKLVADKKDVVETVMEVFEPFPVWVIKLVKESTVNHLLLPWNWHCARAELFEKLFIIGVKLDPFDLREVPDVPHVFGIDDVGLGHQGRLDKPRLQTRKADGFEERMLPRDRKSVV